MINIIVKCDYCGAGYTRSRGRINESLKMGWKQYCSQACLNKSKTTSQLIQCSNQNCGNRFLRKQSATRASGLSFCSHHCSAGYTNTHRINPMSIRRKAKLARQPKCKNPLCKNKLQLQRFQFCSMKCRVVCAKQNDKISVIQSLQEFYIQHGRIPVKYELSGIYSRARNGFGTWNNAIIAAGFEPNPVMFAKHYIAKDGHKCDSMAEKIVDDWLYAKHIEHRVHVPYPWNNGMKCDFLIQDTWVEVFGLEGNLARYDVLKKEKLGLIRKHNLKTLRLSLKYAYSPKKLEKRFSMFTSSLVPDKCFLGGIVEFLDICTL